MDQATEKRLALSVLALLAVGSVAASLLVVTPKPFIDDFFIGTRYAINWVSGNGIVYNPGDPVEGYTSITWIALMTFAVRFGMSELLLTQVVNVGSQLATLWLVYAMGRSVGRSRLESLFAPAVIAFQVSFVAYPMLGMTSSTFALVLASTVYYLSRGALDTLRGSLGLGALVLLVSLLRFDGVGLAFGLLLYPLLVERRVKDVMPAFLVLIVGLAIFNAWRISYYGKPLPNTFYAKNSPISSDVMIGLRYVRDFVLAGGPFGLLVILAPIAAWWRGSRLAKLAIWVCGGHLVYTVAVGGDWMRSFRFMLHVLPLYAFLMQEGLWKLRDLAVERGLPARAAVGAVLAVMLLSVGASAASLANSKWVGGRAHRPGPFWHAGEAVQIGDYLDEALPADAVVATEWAGVIPSRLRQPILDILGLNDSDIISRDDFRASNMGRLPTPEYLALRAPEIVIVVARIWPTIEEAKKGIDARPPSKIKDFYAALRAPENGYELCIMQIEGGYWPCLVRPDFAARGRLCVGG